MRDSVIGKRCNIGQNVVVSPGVRLGDNCKIQNNVSLYTGVILEDDVFCGPSMVFTNVVNPRSEVVRKALLPGPEQQKARLSRALRSVQWCPMSAAVPSKRTCPKWLTVKVA